MRTFNHKILIPLISCFLCAPVATVHSQTPKAWEWVRHLGGPGWDMTGGAAVDAKNNIYVTGTFTDTLKFNKIKLASSGNSDIFIAKFDEKGSPDNLFTVGGHGNDQVSCTALAPNGDVLVGGMATDTVTFGKVALEGKGAYLFIARMDPKGKFLWAKAIYPKGRAILNFIGTGPEGNLYACGQFDDTLTCGGKQLASSGKTDIFIAALSPSGEVGSSISFGGGGDDHPTAFALSGDGTVFCAGNFEKRFALGSVLFNGKDNPYANGFIAKFANNLLPVWGISLNSEEYCKVASIRPAPDNTLYAGGSYNLSLSGADTLLSSLGLSDGFLMKLGGEGNKIWARNIGTQFYDHVNHLNTDILGGVVVTGSIGDTLVLDSLTIAPPSEGNTAFVAQFDPTGNAFWGDHISGSGRNFGETTLLDHKGNLYIYGSFSDKFEKGGGAMPSYGQQDIFLARYHNCPESKAEVIGDPWFCPGLGTDLKVKAGYKNVAWNDTIAGRFLYVDKAGSYHVSMYDKKGCLYTDTLEVKQSPLPRFSLGNDTSLVVGDSILLSGPNGLESYRWHNHSFNDTYLCTSEKPKKELCTLTITDSLGCQFADSIEVAFFVPNELSMYGQIKLNAWPNPVGSTLNWSIDLEGPCTLVVDIADDNGKVLYKEKVGTYSPGQVKQTNVSALAPGAYLIRLSNTQGEVVKTAGFVKQ